VTWLAGVPDADTDWERVAARCPEAMAALGALVDAAFAETDPVLLELARLRIATLLDNPAEWERRTAAAVAAGLAEEAVAELSAWPTSPRFGARERAALALAEQFTLDANGVTDADVAAVAEHLGAVGCYRFVEAVSALEGFQRACLTLGIASRPAAPTTEVPA
jgi:alkylhydroperoxidase family enzyme